MAKDLTGKELRGKDLVGKDFPPKSKKTVEERLAALEKRMEAVEKITKRLKIEGDHIFVKVEK